MVKIKHNRRGRNAKGPPIRVNPLHLFLAVVGICVLTILLAMRSFNSKADPSGIVSSHDVIPGRQHDHYNKQPQVLRPPKMNKQTNPRYFMVFSTGCTPFQNWQGIAFFYLANRINQPGNITRIASGCSEAEGKEQVDIFNKKVRPLSDAYDIHITPDYGVHDNEKYWNKPKGLLDYLENVLGFPERASEYNDDIIMIVDPDMMLLRPLTHTLNDYHAEWITEPTTNKVVHGTPIAQVYGFGSGWLHTILKNLTYVVGPESPVHNVSLNEAHQYYPAGPPYMATGKDMYAIAKHWVEFLPRLHEVFPEFMAEMHAYSTAAAHLQLRHQLAKGFMLSDVGAVGLEAVDFLKNVTRRDACVASIPEHELPFVLHYCQ